MCGCVGQHQHIATTALVGNKRGGELRIDQISEEATFILVSTFEPTGCDSFKKYLDELR